MCWWNRVRNYSIRKSLEIRKVEQKIVLREKRISKKVKQLSVEKRTMAERTKNTGNVTVRLNKV